MSLSFSPTFLRKNSRSDSDELKSLEDMNAEEDKNKSELLSIKTYQGLPPCGCHHAGSVSAQQ